MTRALVELRLDDASEYEVGQQLTADLLQAGLGGSASPVMSGAEAGWPGGFDVAPDHLNGMPIRAAHAGQLAGVMIPYSWILR